MTIHHIHLTFGDVSIIDENNNGVVDGTELRRLRDTRFHRTQDLNSELAELNIHAGDCFVDVEARAKNLLTNSIQHLFGRALQDAFSSPTGIYRSNLRRALDTLRRGDFTQIERDGITNRFVLNVSDHIRVEVRTSIIEFHGRDLSSQYDRLLQRFQERLSQYAALLDRLNIADRDDKILILKNYFFTALLSHYFSNPGLTTSADIRADGFARLSFLRRLNQNWNLHRDAEIEAHLSSAVTETIQQNRVLIESVFDQLESCYTLEDAQVEGKIDLVRRLLSFTDSLIYFLQQDSVIRSRLVRESISLEMTRDRLANECLASPTRSLYQSINTFFNPSSRRPSQVPIVFTP